MMPPLKTARSATAKTAPMRCYPQCDKPPAQRAYAFWPGGLLFGQGSPHRKHSGESAPQMADVMHPHELADEE